MAGKNKRATFAENVQSSTGGEVKRILPSHIRADHANNTSRWACYDPPDELRSYFGDNKICFTLEQIERRLASLLMSGQIDDVDVTISGTGQPDLVTGFLRHCGFLLAEVRGQLDQIPRAKGLHFAGIRANVIPSPKTQSDYAALARRNLDENRERQEMSPVDFAFYLKRRLDSYDDNGVTPTRKQVAEEVGISVRTIELKMQLLSYKPTTLLAVHRGEISEAQAHRQAREKGEGTAKGSLPGIARKAIRRRKPEARPSEPLTPEQIDALIDVIIGDKAAAEVDDDLVCRYIAYADAPAEPKRSTVDSEGNKVSAQGKKAPTPQGRRAAEPDAS